MDPTREPLCEEQQKRDWDLCRMSGIALCWSMAMTRYVACMKNEFVPDLRH